MKKSSDISLKVNMDFGGLLAVMSKSKNPDKKVTPKKAVKSVSKKAAKK
ncbi:MAG: hypothetical protein JWO03_2523 [Bacteroidetes bacterium]|nr:hypothetical protein [Bacteroidota bacterium]